MAITALRTTCNSHFVDDNVFKQPSVGRQLFKIGALPLVAAATDANFDEDFLHVCVISLLKVLFGHVKSTLFSLLNNAQGLSIHNLVTNSKLLSRAFCKQNTASGTGSCL